MYFVWCSILKRRGNGVLIPSVMVDGTWFHIEQDSLQLSSSIKYNKGSSVLSSTHQVEDADWCLIVLFWGFLSVCLDKCLGHALARSILCLTTQCWQRHRSVCCVQILMFLSLSSPAGMLTITDFIIILHRYYKSPMVGLLMSAWDLLLSPLYELIVKPFFFCSCCISGANLWIGGTQAWDVERLASRQWGPVISAITETRIAWLKTESILKQGVSQNSPSCDWNSVFGKKEPEHS